MKLRCSILLFLAFIATGIISAQPKKIDSLEKQLILIRQKSGSYTIDTTKTNLLNALVWEMTNYKIRLDTAMNYAQEALVMSEKIKWNKGIVASYSSIARVHKYQGNQTQAVDYYTKALTIAKELNEKNWAAKALYFIGQTYREQGNLPLALDFFLQSLRINEEMRNSTDIARDLTYIGMIYEEIEDNENALKYYLQALKKNQEVNNKYWIAINLNAIASIHKKEKQFAKSLDYYSQVLNRQKGNLHSMYGTFIDIGDVYRTQSSSIPEGQVDTVWDKAIDYYSRGLTIATEVDDPFAMGMALKGIGWLYLKRNKLKEADEALNKALQLLKSTNRPEAFQECYLSLSRLDSIKGNWKSSLINFKIYTAIDDSLFNKKKSRQLAQVQIKYETDKKQGEIEILNRDNELKNLRIKQQQKNILLIIAVAIIFLLGAGGFIYYRNKKVKQQALKQIGEAKLASLKSLMDKHFIFSSLHSIDTFLMNHNSEAASDYLVKFSKLIRMILEMSNQAEVALEAEVSLCKSYLDLEKIRFNYSFDYEFSIDKNISLQEAQFPSMLLQPLVENAVKHGIGSLQTGSGGSKGFIRISIDKINDKLVCTVADNGKGLQSGGTKPESHRSYSGKGIIERVKVYNTLLKNKASFILKDNHPGVAAVLTLPYISGRQRA